MLVDIYDDGRKFKFDAGNCSIPNDADSSGYRRAVGATATK